MTELLAKAFERVEKLPKRFQDEIAISILEDIVGESKWDETFRKSNGKLKKLAERALKNFQAGRTREKGFDEL